MLAAASLPLSFPPVFFCFSAGPGFRSARPGLPGRPGSLFRAGPNIWLQGRHVSCRPLLQSQAHLTGTTLLLCRQTSAALSCLDCSSPSPSHTDYSLTSIRSLPDYHTLSFLAFSAFPPLWTRGRRPSRLSTNRGPWNARLYLCSLALRPLRPTNSKPAFVPQINPLLTIDCVQP